MLLLNKLRQFISQLNLDNPFFIAYSGGVDSHVLLHAMTIIRQEFPQLNLTAIHINHGLSLNADAWQQHCLSVCEQLKINFLDKKTTIIPDKNESIEEAARNTRYQLFSEILPTAGYLLTAHNQNDQAETVLLQLFRGAGSKGLSAMPENISFANGFLLRPFLAITRDEINKYAAQNNLHWIEDESNQNRSFDRNYLRHEILPLITQRWPDVVNAISRSALLAAENEQLLQILAKADLEFVGNEDKLSVSRLLELDDVRQRNVLRFWLQQQKLSLPSYVRLKQLQKDLLQSRNDANPVMTWDDLEIRRFQDHLYLTKPQYQSLKQWQTEWDLQQPLMLPHDLGVLNIQQAKGQGLNLKKIAHAKITVSFRKEGERCHPQGRVGSHPLKKLFQEWQVPTWQRDTIPLIYVDDKLAAVVGYCVADEFAVMNNDEGIVISRRVD